MKTNAILILLFLAGLFSGQSNTAVTSGSIGKCGVWDYPYTLYNNAAASQTVNNGVTVTVDLNRNIGAVNFSGTGAMSMSGSNGITLSGSGSEINCRWDIAGGGSFTVVNNNGTPSTSGPGLNIGVFFTAPYSGNYYWGRGSGWSASVSGAYLNAGIQIRNDATGTDSSFFYQNQTGSCGTVGAGAEPPTYYNGFGPIALGAGQTMSYTAGTAYSTAAGCNNTTLSLTRGTASMFFDN